MDNYHKQSQSNEFINNSETDFYKTKVKNRFFSFKGEERECLRACAYQSIAEQFLYSRNLPAKVRRSFDPKKKKKNRRNQQRRDPHRKAVTLQWRT
jgi:hypothetical protein